ncbi:hypothetical protein [Psychromonas aquatilis]|uniref:Uncharacterized protein n=1 Tax=Psychromonas aquatilis TaxID=2005072 RepID=A0ABU9GR94_9GAMM
MKNKLIIIGLFSILSASISAGEQCGFSYWMENQGITFQKHTNNAAYVFATSHIKISVSGSQRAYHPDEIGIDCLNKTNTKGLDCPINIGYPNSDHWSERLVIDPINSTRAYQQTSGKYKGFFISKTKLENKQVTDINDPSKYVDATKMPFIKLPSNLISNEAFGQIGDLGISMNTFTGLVSGFVIADTTLPKSRLGDVSIYLAEKLGVIKPNPQTKIDTVNEDILYVIFPGTAKLYPWPLSNEEINTHAMQLLEKTRRYCEMKLELTNVIN